MAATYFTQTEIAWVFLLAGLLVLVLRAPPRRLKKRLPFLSFSLPLAVAVVGGVTLTVEPATRVLLQLFLFFVKAGSFVFGSGLAIVPFLREGVVQQTAAQMPQRSRSRLFVEGQLEIIFSDPTPPIDQVTLHVPDEGHRATETNRAQLQEVSYERPKTGDLPAFRSLAAAVVGLTAHREKWQSPIEADNLTLARQRSGRLQISGQLLISAGSGLAIVDTARDERVAAVGLPGHPEGFALEQSGPRAFVNVPVPSKGLFVVDRAKGAVMARWTAGGPLANIFSNFPMALDEVHQRLFVGTRVPASLKVLDTSSGRLVRDLKIDGDADDVFYDRQRTLVYVSCGQGFLDVLRQVDPDHYERVERTPTAAGARTSLWVSELSQLFVAVPRREKSPAEILVFEGE